MKLQRVLGMSFDGPEGQEDMPYLLTPGPVTTSRTVKMALLADWDAHGPEFSALMGEIRQELLKLAGCDDSYECIVFEGSTETAIEAAVGSFTPAKRKKTLILSNGNSGAFAASVLEKLGRPIEHVAKTDQAPLAPELMTQVLDKDTSISHVWIAHGEMNCGIVNALSELAQTVKARECTVVVDATNTFGATNIDLLRDNIDVLVGTSGLCLEGLPGCSFIIAKRSALVATERQSPSSTLDVNKHWKRAGLSNNLSCTTPTHLFVAFRQALRELEEEGGIAVRARRYKELADVLFAGMSKFGFKPVLSASDTGPLVQAFLSPRDTNFAIEALQNTLRLRGFAIAPGAMAQRETFRVATIGRLNEAIIQRFIGVMKSALIDLDIKDLMPKDL